jgi:DNA-binding MarR family transcriptional regulator
MYAMVGARMKAMLEELEDLPLDELMMAWTNYVWMMGMRPMYHEMAVEGLSLAETVVLRSVQQRGPLKVAEVADCISITQSAASRAVDRLVRDGLVNRHENPDDRRQKQLTLTRSGEALLEKFQGIMARAVGPLMRALTSEEQDQFRTLIVKMLSTQRGSHQLVTVDEAAELIAKVL